MSSNIASKEHAAWEHLGMCPPMGGHRDDSRGRRRNPVWATDHNGTLAFGSRPARPTKLQKRGNDL